MAISDLPISSFPISSFEDDRIILDIEVHSECSSDDSCLMTVRYQTPTVVSNGGGSSTRLIDPSAKYEDIKIDLKDFYKSLPVKAISKAKSSNKIFLYNRTTYEAIRHKIPFISSSSNSSSSNVKIQSKNRLSSKSGFTTKQKVTISTRNIEQPDDLEEILYILNLMQGVQ